MGVGWSLAVPEIALVRSKIRQDIDWGDENAFHGGRYFIRDRWVSNQVGELLCEVSDDVKSLQDSAWFSDPHGPIRYKPVGILAAESWIAQDPFEGVTQYFGENAASRLHDEEGKPVAWLLSREETEFGKELRYFYEELEGANQRILRAILGAGNNPPVFR